MNTNDRWELEMTIADCLRAGLLETWNAGELASDVVDALGNEGWEVTREPERCHSLVQGIGAFGVVRCVRHVDHGGDHQFALSDAPGSPRLIPDGAA